MLFVSTLLSVSIITAAPPTPTFPISWTSQESEVVAIAQGTTTGPNGEICCAPTAPQCQAQVQSQVGTHSWDGVNNQTRFATSDQIIITQYQIGKEMSVAPNGTCLQYCPTEGGMDPSPFWPTPDQKEHVVDLGKKTVNGVECQHYQWTEHILGIIKVEEVNMYLKLATADAGYATPVWEHDIIEPFGQQAGIEDTHWTEFTPGQPDASLFKVTGVANCAMSPNCGNDNQMWMMRRLRDRDFVSYIKHEQEGNLRAGRN